MAVSVRVPDINVVILAGRLTRDPDIRYTAGGKAVARVRLANSRRFRNPTSNEWQEEATFIDATIWGEAAERAKDRLRKGSPILLEGRLQSDEWEAKDGTKRTAIKITARRVQFLESQTADISANAPSAGTVETPPEAPADLGPRLEETEPTADMEGVAL